MDFLATMPILNLVILLVFVIVFVILMNHLLKGKKIKAGNVEISEDKKQTIINNTRLSEREIVKRQIHVARAVCSNFKFKIPHSDKYSDAQEENICHKVSDAIEDLILFNHLSTDEYYVKSRFEVVWSVIKENINNNFTKEDEAALYDLVNKDFEKLIGVLLSIREERE